jgi:hypothetical protein
MIHFLQPAVSVLAMQLYFLTIVCIGWALISALAARRKNKQLLDWPALPIPAKFLLAAASGFVLFSIFTIVAYALSLHLAWIVAAYVISLLWASFYIVTTQRRTVFDGIRTIGSGITSIKLLSPMGLLTIALIIDLVLALFIGSFMGGDGFVHVSKIRHILEHGFTLTDAYYGTAPETRHTLSVLHTLLAVPAWFGIDPISCWYASAAFFKLLRISAIFYLAWRTFGWVAPRQRTSYAALVTLLSLALFNNSFISYPSLFVCTWIILLIVGLFDAVHNRNLLLLPIAGLLIATTHPLAAVACALLLILTGVIYLIFDRQVITKRFVLALAAAGLLLISTPLFTATLPDQMTTESKEFGVADYSYIHVSGLEAFRPTASQYFTTDAFTPMPTWLWVLSALGVIGLFVFIKKRRDRLLVATILLYVPLILYNPLAFSVLKHELPVWGIARFTAVNQLTLLLAFYGLLMLFYGLSKVSTVFLRENIRLVGLTVVTVVLFLATQTYGVVDPKNLPDKSMYDQQSMIYSNLSAIAAALPDDKNAIVLAERTVDSFMIPVVAPLRVVAIHTNNSTPAADMIHRSACFNKLYTTLDPSLLEQANVRYVLANRNEAAFYNLALANPSLHIAKATPQWVLFSVDSENVPRAHDPVCIFHE